MAITRNHVEMNPGVGGSKAATIQKSESGNNRELNRVSVEDPDGASTDIATVAREDQTAKGVNSYPLGRALRGWYPNMRARELSEGQVSPIGVNPDGLIEGRMAAVTDEGSVIDAFPDSGLHMAWDTGDVSITFNASTGKISRAAGSFVTDGAIVGDYIWTTSRSSGNMGVFRVTAAAALELTVVTEDGSAPEFTDGAETVSVYAMGWDQKVAGAGQSITVANGACTLQAGSTANAEAYIGMMMDYFPMKCITRLSISQRVANQEIFLEMVDGADPAKDRCYARFRWTGTDDTVVFCESSHSPDTGNNEGVAAAISQEPTSSPFDYTLEMDRYGMYYHYNDAVPLAKHRVKFPQNYRTLYMRIRVKNGATPPTGNTQIVVSLVNCININRLDVTNSFGADPMHVVPVVETRTQNPKPSADQDEAYALADHAGRQVVVSENVRENKVKKTLVITSDVTEKTLIAAGGAGIAYDLVGLWVTNKSSSAVLLTIRDELGTAVADQLHYLKVPANDVRGLMIPGCSIPQTAANKAWTVQGDASVDSLYVNAIFIKNKIA